MKNALWSLMFAAVLGTSAFASDEDLARTLPGSWQGTLDVGPTKLRVVFNIADAANSRLTATMDSPDQGARGIPVDSVALSGTSLVMEANAIKGVYRGTLDPAGNAITGQWTQGGQSLPLNLTKREPGAAAAGEAPSPADFAASKEAADALRGTWIGTLNTPAGAALRLRVNVTTTATGTVTGTMESLDQGANEIPITAITLRAGKVRFEVRGVGGVYEGDLAADGSTLDGEWQQGGASLPLVLQRAASQ